MFGWLIGVPVGLTLMLLGLEYLEARFVAPIDRADKVQRLLHASVSADEIEASVAKLLEPSMRWSPHDTRRVEAPSSAEAAPAAG